MSRYEQRQGGGIGQANIARLNTFLNPTGPSDAATASIRAQRASDWANFVANYKG